MTKGSAMNGAQWLSLSRWIRRAPHSPQRAATTATSAPLRRSAHTAWRASVDGLTVAGMAAPVAMAPALSIITRSSGYADLLAVIPALSLLALASVFMRADARRLIQLDLFAAAVGAYALTSAGSSIGFAPGGMALWRQAASISIQVGLALAPVALYFGGISLCSSPETLRRAMRWLAVALLGATIPLSGVSLLHLFTGTGSTTPTTIGLPDLATLANLIGITLVIATVADAPNAALRWWLGEEQARTAWRRAWFWAGRSALAVLAMASLLAVFGGLLATGSRTALVATALALLGVSFARKRYGRFSFFAGLAALALCVVPRGENGWLGNPLVALHASIAPAQAPAYLASLALIGLALARFWLAYRRLRPTGEAAGVTLAALGCAIYLLIAGMASTPLGEPAATLAFWPLLGMAAGIANTLERQQIALEAPGLSASHRGFPLRVAFVVEKATAADDTLAALAESLRSFDPRRVVAIPIAWSRIAAGSPGHVGLRARAGRAIGYGSAWLTLIRATLAARPDLLVASSPMVYLPVLFAGRALGIPVQWHARERANPRLQFALDVFAPMTTGIVATSQYVARSFQIESLGRRLRVVRLGLAMPTPLTPGQRTMVRALLGVDDGDTLAIVPAPIAPESGHFDLMQAILLARDHFPRLRVALASEHVADGHRHDAALARLQVAITLNGLEDVVRLVGPCANLAELVGSSDLAVFPQWSAPLSRGVAMALASGLPIVATRGGALGEQLTDAWGCLFAEPRDPAGLALALADALHRLGELHADAQHNKAISGDWQRAEIEAARLQTLYRAICLPDRSASAYDDKHAGAPGAGRMTSEHAPILSARSRAWASALWDIACEPYDQRADWNNATNDGQSSHLETGDALVLDGLGDQPVGVVHDRRAVAGEARLNIQPA